MYTKITASLNRIHPVVWQSICLIVSLLIFSLILLNRSPNILRSAGMSLRTGFGLVIPLTVIILYLILQIPGRLGQLISFTGVMSLFALGLAGLWASGQTHSIILNGLLPISDATNYYIDALRIINGMEIFDFSAMRPFFPGFLSFLLWLSGKNLMTALGVLTAIAGISSFLLVREIQRTYWAETAAFFLVLIFLYHRHHSGTTMSESLGLTFALLGTALIWQGASAKKAAFALFGIVMIAFGLNIRPGAMFVLPALLLWGGYVFRGEKKFSLQFLFGGAVLIAIVFYLNNVMIKALAGPDAAAFSNFSWALYGLVSGGNSWTYIFEAHPELSLLLEAEVTSAIYRLSIELVLHEPTLLIKGALHYWGMFFSNTWYNAFSFVAGENYYANEAARWSMYLLSGVGIFKWLKDRKDPYASLAVITALGVLASVPFVPPTHAYRVRLYAATIPFFCLLPAIGVSYLSEKLGLHKVQTDIKKTPGNQFATIFSATLLAVMLVAPPLIKAGGERPVLPETACPADMGSVTVQFDEGTYVNVLRENIFFVDWMPNFHIGLFRRSSHDHADSNFTAALDAVNPPSTLFYALDLQSNSEALVIAEEGVLSKPGELLHLCGYWDDNPNASNYKIFHAIEPAAMP